MKNPFHVVSPFKRSDVYFVLTVSGLLGFFFGSQAECNWQNAVEGAQVIAGLVKYPPANPFFMYQVKAWTFLHQFLALLLRMGFSERTLSIFTSGIMGAFSLQAFSLLTLCFSRNKWTAILAPLFISYSSIYAFGTVYAVSLMGSMTTYGIIGMAWIMMTFALLSLGEAESGGWMLGMAPAIHPTLGLFSWVIAGIAGWFERREIKPHLKKWVLFFLLGCFCSLISWIFYEWRVHEWLPKGMSIDKATFVNFVKMWDGHRVPVPFNSEDTYFNLAVFLISWSWLVFFQKDLFTESRFILRVLMVSAILGMSAMVFTWMPIEKMPALLVSMMPGRILSIAIFGFGPLLIGLADRYRGNQAADLFLVFFLLILLCVVRGMHLDFYVLLSLLMVFAVLFLILKWFAWIKIEESNRGNFFLRAVIFLVFGMSAAAHFFHAAHMAGERHSAMKDWTNDSFFATTAKDQKSLLLIGPDIGSIQLLPVVLW